MLLHDLLLLLAGGESLSLRQRGSWGSRPAVATAVRHLLWHLPILPHNRRYGLLMELSWSDLLVLPARCLPRRRHELRAAGSCL